MFLEIRNQKHLMYAEGSSDVKPTKAEIIKAIKERGYKTLKINMFYDEFQGFWRFNADIKPKYNNR